MLLIVLLLGCLSVDAAAVHACRDACTAGMVYCLLEAQKPELGDLFIFHLSVSVFCLLLPSNTADPSLLYSTES